MDENKIIITKLSQQFNSKYELLKDKLACVLFNDNQIFDIKIFDTEENNFSKGNIFLSRIINIDKRLNAAMLNINDDYTKKQAFFSLKKYKNCNFKSNDIFLLQIIKEEIKTKPINVSADIELNTNLTNISFKYSLSANTYKINISKKIKDEHFIKQAYDKINNVLDCLFLDSNYNTILEKYNITINIRTIAYENDENLDKTISDIKKLLYEFKNLYNVYKYSTKMSLLKKNNGGIYEFINRYSSYNPLCVTDNIEVYEIIKNDFRTRLYNDKLISLNNLYSIDINVEKCFNKKVWLDSGAYIVIEPTEAATIIDVNSGKNIKKFNDEKLFYEINNEAALEIARQLRIRELSGIILIDFINMKDNNNINKLIYTLKKEFKYDKNNCNIFGMTKLQLLELTREVKYPNIYKQIFK